MQFFDDNTRSWWTPITGGANVPALNDLLAPHNISLGERILTGTAKLGPHNVQVSGPRRGAPAGGPPLKLRQRDDAAAARACTARPRRRRARLSLTPHRRLPATLLPPAQLSYGANIASFPAGGFLHRSPLSDVSGKGSPVSGDFAAFGIAPSGKGHVAVLGDTNCLDSSHLVRRPRGGACMNHHGRPPPTRAL